MALILDAKYQNTSLFFSNRALRIFPTYLVVLGISYYYFSAHYPPFLSSFKDVDFITRTGLILTNLALVGQDIWLFFGYQNQEIFFSPKFNNDVQLSRYMLVPQAWTLSLELYFYALAPAFVKLKSRYIAAIVILGFALKFYAVHNGFQHEPWTYRFFPFELPLFLCGVLLYRIGKEFKPQHGHLWTLIITILILFFPFISSDELVGMFAAQTLFLCILAAAIPAMFFSTSGWFDRQIGELSYPLYLCHIAIMRFLTPLEVIRDSPALRTFFVVFFSILIAIALRILIDLPMNIYRQNRFSQAQGKQ